MIKLLLVGLAAYALWYAWRAGWFAGPGMTEAEALRLLELPVDADVEQVRAAHRRLIARVHPDAGGSAALTAKVNAARDTLLSSRRSR